MSEIVPLVIQITIVDFRKDTRRRENLKNHTRLRENPKKRNLEK